MNHSNTGQGDLYLSYSNTIISFVVIYIIIKEMII